MKKSIIEKIFIVILIIIFICAFSKSYSSLNIDNLAYVVALGFDTSTNDKIKITFQFINVSGEQTMGDSEIITDSVESSSIDSGINLMNSYFGKQLNLAHCKIVAFSEEFANNSIEKEISTLINNTQLRPDANVIITKSDTKSYLENSKPALENLITKYYEVFPFSSEYTGYTENITIGKIFYLSNYPQKNPTAMLGSMIPSDSTSNSSSLLENSSINATRKSENIGLAIFDNNLKLIGELDSLETLCHMIITNNVESFVISVPHPNDNTSKIDLSSTISSSPKIHVNIINGTPYIILNLSINSKLLTIDSKIDYSNSEFIKNLSYSMNNYLKTELEQYLYKTSKDFNSDIDGFGTYAVKNNITLNYWNNLNWQDLYQDSFFEVNIDSDISSALLLK